MSDRLFKESDAIKAIYKLKKTVTKHKDLSYHDGLFDALEAIQDLPPAERPQAWWVYAGVDLDGIWYYRCSECLGEVENRTYPHCPYCLTKMERIDNETD